MQRRNLAPTSGTAAELSRRRLLQLGGGLTAAGATGSLMASCSRAPADGGAGGAGGAGGDDKTFTFYTNPGHAYDTWAEVIKQFEADHGITVNWQKFQWPDLTTRLQADVASGNVPDLTEYSGGDNTMSFVTTGDVLGLDDYIAKDGKEMGFPDDWQDAAVTPWQHDGTTYGIQLQLTCQQIYYNKTMLSDAGISGPPDTWDDLLAAAKELTRDDVYGMALNQDASYSYPWILQAGGVLYDADAEGFLSPRAAATEALQFQQDLCHKHKVSPVPVASNDYSGPQKLLSANRAAMIITGPWDIKPIREGSPDLDLGLGLPLKNEERLTHLAGSGVFIPEKSRHPDLAWDLIKRLTALETELALTKESGQTMPRKTWAEHPDITSDPVMQKLAEALQYTVDWGEAVAPSGKLPVISDAYKTLYQSVVLSRKPVDAELQSFVKAAQAAHNG